MQKILLVRYVSEFVQGMAIARGMRSRIGRSGVRRIVHTTAIEQGGAIRALNNVISQFEADGISAANLPRVVLAGVALAGASGLNVNYNTKTGEIAVTYKEAGSRLYKNHPIATIQKQE